MLSFEVQRCIDATTSVAGDGGAVGELEARPQGEGPELAVLRGRPLVDHLRLRLALLVEAEGHVVDHVAEVARDVRGGEGRVEDLHVGVGDDLERLGLRRGGQRGGAEQGGARETGGEAGEVTSLHVRVSVRMRQGGRREA
jgi:hypothetical protein